MPLQEMALAEMVEDLSVYPRGSVNLTQVQDLVLAMEAGAQLPPPVIDGATRKLVDGFHRRRAYLKRLGDEGIITVDVRDYPSDAEMLLESARLNSAHGLRLSRYDQRHVVIKARALGLPDDATADALGVTPVRLKGITVLQAESDAGPVPLKRGVEHLGGRYITPDQLTEIRRMRGGRTRDKASELTRMLQQEGLVPVASDAALRQVLADLGAAIADSLAPWMTSDGLLSGDTEEAKS